MPALNFAVIGAGNIGKIHVAAIQQIPDARVSVVCSRTEATGRRASRSV